MKENHETGAYKLGAEACKEGTSVRANPFLKGCQGYYLWKLGWIETYNKNCGKKKEKLSL